MKLLRTADPYREVIIDGRRIGGSSVKVSNSDADKLTELAASAGVTLVATDTDDKDPAPAPQAVADTPDLSAGVAAITGGGNVITNDESGVIVPEAGGNSTSAGTAQEA